MPGLLVAAPMSGSGKTTITLGLLRALRRRGVGVAPGKAGPDYIDPAFHSAASGAPCLNYDPWAMRPELLRTQAAGAGSDLLLIEAMMGLFDGAADGSGSAADLAALLGLPVILVVNCARLSHSVAPLVNGFLNFDPGVKIAGLILNNVGSARHEAMLRTSLAAREIVVLGVVRRDSDLQLPERHLGLVQATEHGALESFIETAAHRIEQGCDIEAILAVAAEPEVGHDRVRALVPPGQRVAVARDIAFAFCYEHLLQGWRSAGAEIRFFSPLADEGPDPGCDAVFLPGGYPELHAGAIAHARGFRDAMLDAARRGVQVYGECGGYMVLGETLIDASGVEHEMLGLLPLRTSFAARRLHLGYRTVIAKYDFWWRGSLKGHEFHYATTVREGEADRLFDVRDARGEAMPPAGLMRGSVMGSFMHIVDGQTSA